MLIIVQNVNTVYQSEVTGPTVEFQFKLGFNFSVKVGYKKLKTKEWNVTISPEHDKVHWLLLRSFYLTLSVNVKTLCYIHVVLNCMF